MRVNTTAAFRKALGQRIKTLRKKADLGQKELAAEIGISFGQLNKYESGLNSPSPELLPKLAARLHVTVDYLVTGAERDDIPVSNQRLVDRLRAIEQFAPKDQEMVIQLIDAMIVKHRAEGMLRI